MGGAVPLATLDNLNGAEPMDLPKPPPLTVWRDSPRRNQPGDPEPLGFLLDPIICGAVSRAAKVGEDPSEFRGAVTLALHELVQAALVGDWLEFPDGTTAVVQFIPPAP
jgi:hypothetical protein